MKDCVTRSNKSPEATTICDVHCSHQRLLHKRVHADLEEDIEMIEVQGAWRPSNKFAESNPPSGILAWRWLLTAIEERGLNTHRA
ncbi:hypothetical protein TNCV_2733171 [Trichonephila clavipes]|nr:hypothetical protein TNCV_2733171 [Trichonephila clavipes]